MKTISVEFTNMFSMARSLTIFVVIAIGSIFIVELARAELPELESVKVLDAPREIATDGLVDQYGRSFTFNQLRGSVVFVMFGFTNCPDICPMTLQRLRQLEVTHRGDMVDVAYVMISVDGERDTTRALNGYLSGFSSSFIGVTGDSAAISSAAVQFSAAFFKGVTLAEELDYTVAHSPQIFVIDPAGQLRGEVHDGSVETMYSVSTALAEEQQELSAGVRN